MLATRLAQPFRRLPVLPTLRVFSSAAAAQKEFIPTKKDIKYLMDGGLPVDQFGTIKLPKAPSRELCHDFLAKKHVSDEILREHFLGMVHSLFKGIAAGDNEAIHKVCEVNFAQKLIANRKANNVTYTVPKDLDSAFESTYLIDKLFIKGISTDRDYNDSNADYEVVKDQEDIGLRTYIHKFHLGLQPYYWKKVQEKQLLALTKDLA